MRTDFLSLHPDAFGLDLSDLSLKIVKFKNTRHGIELVSFGNFPVPEGLLEQGEIKKEGELARVIQKTLAQVHGEKLQTRYVVASLPEEKAFLQVIQLPPMQEKDVRSAVNFEIENYVPYSPETVYIDSKIVPAIKDHLNHVDVLLAALPRKIVDSYLSLLQKAGLVPLVFEIESLASSRSLVPQEISQIPMLLVDLGATRTSIIVFAGFSVRFTVSIAISSAQLSIAIAKTMGIDVVKAETLKIQYGVHDMESKEGREVFDSLVPSLVDLKEQIKKYIDYYEAHTAHEHLMAQETKIKKILLAGGGANLPGLREFLEKDLKIPVALGNPWVNILPQPFSRMPPFPLSKALEYGTALGLALRGLNP